MEEGTSDSRLPAVLVSGPQAQRAAQWVGSAQLSNLARGVRNGLSALYALCACKVQVTFHEGGSPDKWTAEHAVPQLESLAPARHRALRRAAP